MMNEQNEALQIIHPAKRRRGRPRKEGNYLKKDIGSSPVLSESLTKVQQCDENMIGKSVSGVIDGCFDAGFFLSVKIGGNDGPMLRGVIFETGRVVPITSANDIAPQAKLHQRNQLTHPIRNQSAINNITIPEKTVMDDQNQDFKYVENLRMVEQDDVMQVYEVSVQSEDTESAKNTIITHQSPQRVNNVAAAFTSDVMNNKVHMGSGLHLSPQIQNDFLQCTGDYLVDICTRKSQDIAFKDQQFDSTRPNQETLFQCCTTQVEQQNNEPESHVNRKAFGVVNLSDDNQNNVFGVVDTAKIDGSTTHLQTTNSSGVTMPLDLEIAAEELTMPSRPEFNFSIGCSTERET